MPKNKNRDEFRIGSEYQMYNLTGLNLNLWMMNSNIGKGEKCHIIRKKTFTNLERVKFKLAKYKLF